MKISLTKLAKTFHQGIIEVQAWGLLTQLNDASQLADASPTTLNINAIANLLEIRAAGKSGYRTHSNH